MLNYFGVMRKFYKEFCYEIQQEGFLSFIKSGDKYFKNGYEELLFSEEDMYKNVYLFANYVYNCSNLIILNLSKSIVIKIVTVGVINNVTNKTNQLLSA